MTLPNLTYDLRDSPDALLSSDGELTGGAFAYIFTLQSNDVLEHLGIGLSSATSAGLTTFSASITVRNYEIIAPHGMVEIHSTIDRIGSKSFTMTHRMYHPGKMVVVSEFELVSVVVDLAKRKSVAIPEMLRVRLQACTKAPAHTGTTESRSSDLPPVAGKPAQRLFRNSPRRHART